MITVHSSGNTKLFPTSGQDTVLVSLTHNTHTHTHQRNPSSHAGRHKTICCLYGKCICRSQSIKYLRSHTHSRARAELLHIQSHEPETKQTSADCRFFFSKVLVGGEDEESCGAVKRERREMEGEKIRIRGRAGPGPPLPLSTTRFIHYR